MKYCALPFTEKRIICCRHWSCCVYIHKWGWVKQTMTVVCVEGLKLWFLVWRIKIRPDLEECSGFYPTEEYSVLLVKQCVFSVFSGGRGSNLSLCVILASSCLRGCLYVGAKAVQFSAPMFLCSLHSSVCSHQELVPGLLRVGDLLRQSGTSEPVAASKFISSAVDEQVSSEYSKAWCHSRNTPVRWNMHQAIWPL